MTDRLFNLYQAMQLVALGPCIFLVFFLLLTLRHTRNAIIPVLYFLSLICSFMLPLLPFIPGGGASAFSAVLMAGESLSFAFAFLLIMQLLLGRVPPLAYWCILALPVVGGGPIIYGALIAENFCLSDGMCIEAADIRVLYSLIASAVMFLLLVVNFSRADASISRVDIHRPHKYWMIIALTLMHLNLLVVDLSVLSGHLDVQRSQIIITVIRLAFIYLVMTSLFRVFDQFFQLDMSRIPSAGSTRQNAKDDEWVEKITEALEEAKAYREMGLNRERFAAQLDLQEHQLSRIINVYFKRSFTELLNHYRVQEAMERLKQETTPITVIAFEVGFNSIASFNRVFKDVVGCSPTEYRNRSH